MAPLRVALWAPCVRLVSRAVRRQCRQRRMWQLAACRDSLRRVDFTRPTLTGALLQRPLDQAAGPALGASACTAPTSTPRWPISTMWLIVSHRPARTG